jgi:hypothetical protein
MLRSIGLCHRELFVLAGVLVALIPLYSVHSYQYSHFLGGP